MGSRLELHEELKQLVPNVYFQPPSNIQMVYPCIVYHKIKGDTLYGNNYVYLNRPGYQLTVIDRDPDSTIADNIKNNYEYCGINQYFTVDNLNHTILSLYY